MGILYNVTPPPLTMLTCSESQPAYPDPSVRLPPQHHLVDALFLLVDVLSGGDRASGGEGHPFGDVSEKDSVSTPALGLCDRPSRPWVG